jgi:hypothetical protein
MASHQNSKLNDVLVSCSPIASGSRLTGVGLPVSSHCQCCCFLLLLPLQCVELAMAGPAYAFTRTFSVMLAHDKY